MRKQLIWVCATLALSQPAMGQSFLSHSYQENSSENRILGPLKGKVNPNAVQNSAQTTPTETQEANLASKLLFNKNTLAEIGQLQLDGELNQAQEMLQQLTGSAALSTEFELLESFAFLELQNSFLLGNYKEAGQLGHAFLQTYANGPNFALAFYCHNMSLAQLKQPLEGTDLFQLEFFSHLSKRQSSSLRTTLIEHAIQQRDYFGALNYIEDESQNVIPAFESWFNHIISHFEHMEDIDDLLLRYQATNLRNTLYLRKINLWVQEGSYEKAKNYLAMLLAKTDLDQKTYSELQALNSFILNSQEVQPYRIGVLLPLSHPRFGGLAQQVLEGLELALQAASTEEHPFELSVEDTYLKISKKDKKQGADYIYQIRQRHVQDKVRYLVATEKVIAIVGPLSKNSSIAAGQAAGNYQVPIISFSLTEEIAKDQPFLFRYQRNLVHESQTIARYSMDYLGAKRFVIFYPSHKNGLKQMSAFMEEVKANGGSIVGIAQVGSKQVDFQSHFKAMTGGYKKLSAEEVQEIRQARETGNSDVDFDAIYLPLKPHRVNTISSFATLYDAQDAWILGSHQLNAPENILIQNTKKLRFLDSYSTSSSLTYLKPFYEKHWKSFGYKRRYQPPTAYTIFAYEAAQLLSQLLTDTKNHNREVLKNRLSNLKDHPVLTGSVTTSTSHEITKDLKILKIKGKYTKEVF